MAEKKWTPAQLLAIETLHKTLLVSAAAGSGKTATLTERITRSILLEENPADISKMLIVTFTKAAAEELKTRIFQAIEHALAQNPTKKYLTDQLIKLASAKICTIDAFYLDLVHTNFSTLGISPTLRIGNDAELALLSKSVMEETIEHFYNTDDRFSPFVECLIGTRSADRLSNELLRYASRADSLIKGIEHFRISAEMLQSTADDEFFTTRQGVQLKQRIADLYGAAIPIFTDACTWLQEQDPQIENALLPAFTADLNYFNEMCHILTAEGGTYSEAKNLYKNHATKRAGQIKVETIPEELESIKALRSTWNNKIREYGKKVFSMTPEELQRAMRDTANYSELLYRVLKFYSDRLSDEKTQRGIMDFNDVRRKVLELLADADGNPTETARQYAAQFSHIYIDEYQDVDEVQDMIFTLISTPTNRFMVGDIKQSIYSFRGADPSVFSHYRTLFPDSKSPEAEASNCMTIFMSDNFRCDKSVIDFTNEVCGKVFTMTSEGVVDYCKDDDLRRSKELPYKEYTGEKVHVKVLLAPKDEDSEDENVEFINNESEEAYDTEDDDCSPEKRAIEADYIAEEIARLIREEYKADGTRISAGDIAVLFRSRAMSGHLAEALSRRGILSSESDSAKYFESPDVLLVLCILNAVDNPHRDIFLSGTLRSPIFGFTMNDLLKIRKICSNTYSLYDSLLTYGSDGEDKPLAQKCTDFVAALERLRESSRALPVDRFLRLLFESDLFLSSGLYGDNAEDGGKGNLQRLYEYARTFESGSFKGLYNFIEFINKMIEEDKTIKIPSKGASPDRVNLMTIHQSKGLEFPVCFVCGAANKFNRRDQYGSLLIDSYCGVAMKLSDSTGFARVNTPMRETLSAISGEKLTQEEIRILYVAMTRARERLYITAITSDTEEKLTDKARFLEQYSTRYAMLHTNSYLEWILPIFARSKQVREFATLEYLTWSQNDTASVGTQSSLCTDLDNELFKNLCQQFAFQYPYKKLRKIPAKLSVSRLTPDILDEQDTSVDLEKSAKTEIPDFFRANKTHKISATERGTATHLFLQFCDFTRGKTKGYKDELARLISKGFLPSDIGDLIYENEPDLFFNSGLMDVISTARELHREQRFNLLLSPEPFSKDNDFHTVMKGERLAVQGVIDLVLLDQDGRLCLYDYKTDRLTKEELEDPALASKRLSRDHGLQLSYYAHAASLLFDRPCSVLQIYSTHSGLLYDVTPTELKLPAESVDTV